MAVALHLGPRNCGKSLCAERRIDQLAKRKLYVGTLWHDPKHEETLYNHRRRRDVSWDLVETTGSLINDAHKITLHLKKHPEIQACLIDGLTTWAIHGSAANGSIFHSAIDVGNTLQYLFSTFADTLWIVVDVAPESFHYRDEVVERLSCNRIRLDLMKSIENLQVHYWR